MNRKSFMRMLGLGAMAAPAVIQRLSALLPATDPLPTLFFGHGSPMNALEENAFVEGWRNMAQRLTIRPEAILCISAHWETFGTRITGVAMPPTIHDFGGFPAALHAVQYPAPGHPGLAQHLVNGMHGRIALDQEWGLDHGTWTVLRRVFPNADIPVLQLSLDRRLDAASHVALAKELGDLRNRGVLIIGSGNMVHNLSQVSWPHMNEIGYAHAWAETARMLLNDWVLKGDLASLISAPTRSDHALQLAIPTPEHYLPLLYVLANQMPGDSIELFNDYATAGSLTMTSVAIGLKA